MALFLARSSLALARLRGGGEIIATSGVAALAVQSCNYTGALAMHLHRFRVQKAVAVVRIELNWESVAVPALAVLHAKQRQAARPARLLSLC